MYIVIGCQNKNEMLVNVRYTQVPKINGHEKKEESTNSKLVPDGWVHK